MKDIPAFPVLVVDRPEELIHFNGMTLRDYFAAKAMESCGFTIKPYNTTDETAEKCYAMADAMLKARQAK